MIITALNTICFFFAGVLLRRGWKVREAGLIGAALFLMLVGAAGFHYHTFLGIR